MEPDKAPAQKTPRRFSQSSSKLYPERLTTLEARFIHAYMGNGCDGRAAVEAICDLRGPKAAARARSFLDKPLVQFHIREQIDAQAVRLLLTSDRTIQEIMRLAMYNAADCFDANGDPIPINELPRDLAAAIEGFDTEEIMRPGSSEPVRITKYKFAKKQGPLQMLVDHLSLVVRKFEVTGKDGAPLNPSKVDLSDVSTELLKKIVEKVTE